MKKYILVFILIVFIVSILGLTLYLRKRIFEPNYFYSIDSIIGYTSPDTLRIKTKNNKTFDVTSYLIMTPKGDEGCKKAKKMAAGGYKITKKLLANAKTLRLVPMKTMQDGIPAAEIYLDEVRLGTTLYKAGFALKYSKNTNYCK